MILVGEVDLVDIEKLDDCLATFSGTVIVDLNAVTFLGSTGLRSFVVAKKRPTPTAASFCCVPRKTTYVSRTRDHRPQAHADRHGERRWHARCVMPDAALVER